LAERCGSGDGERETSMTRQIAFEPLPASVLFGLGVASGLMFCRHDVSASALEVVISRLFICWLDYFGEWSS